MLYDEISNECGLPDGSIKGNAMLAIRYEANGEASDWLLGKYGILAVSPELGTRNNRTDAFFIEDP